MDNLTVLLTILIFNKERLFSFFFTLNTVLINDEIQLIVN